MKAALPIALAAGFVLVGATDWRVEPAGICAVDRTTCEAALAARHADLAFRDLPYSGFARCDPAPWCRPAREDCIEGFNCGSEP